MKKLSIMTSVLLALALLLIAALPVIAENEPASSEVENEETVPETKDPVPESIAEDEPASSEVENEEPVPEPKDPVPENETMKERLQRLYPDPEVGLPMELCAQFCEQIVKDSKESLFPWDGWDFITPELCKHCMDILLYRNGVTSPLRNCAYSLLRTMVIERAFAAVLYEGSSDEELETLIPGYPTDALFLTAVNDVKKYLPYFTPDKEADA